MGSAPIPRGEASKATLEAQVTCVQGSSARCGMQVTVVRNGQTEEISTADLLVGDVMLMGTGDILPADGLLFQGNDIRQAFCTAMALFPNAIRQRPPP